MLRDVFYFGNKPNSHPREQHARDLAHARSLSTTEHFWIINEHCDYRNFNWDFDFDFLPDEDTWAREFNNAWPSTVSNDSGTWLCPIEEVETFIYRMDVEPIQTKSNWNILTPIDMSFDFNWRPDPLSPPYIYTWGNKYIPAEIQPTLEYRVEDATERKYMGEVTVVPQWSLWKELIPVDKDTFDFTWRPDPREPAFIYVFGNKWNDATVEPTIEYHVPNAVERKYVTDIVAVTKPTVECWDNMNIESFDYSWRPNPHSPPQIHQWENGGPCYTVEGANEVVLMEYTSDNQISNVQQYYIKTTLEDLIHEHIDEVFWALNPDLNYDKFDFNWKPDRENFRHINTFGNEYSKNTQTYFVNGPMYKLGHTEFNYVEVAIQVESNLSMFYIDRGLGKDRFDSLKDRYPQLQRTRYLNSWVETIQRCCNKSETKLLWVLNSELDYSQFNFDFYPTPWQIDMVHVFGTQWSHWGNTYLVNKRTFEEHTKYVKVIEHLNILNFVKTKRARATEKLYETALIDFGNVHNIIADYQVTYKGSYLETFKELLNILPNKREHCVWVCSSICSYDKFDFTYICDPYAKQQLHVFPSGLQKFGDTFLIDVNKLRENIVDITKLEEFDKVNYNQHQRVTRLPCPVYTVEDSQVEMTTEDYNFPYAVFISSDNKDIVDDEPLNVWDEKSTDILVTSTGASRVIVPKIASKYIKSELYNYPYIKKSSKVINSNPLDIVFLSNGENKADEHYERLLFIASKFKNRVVRVDKVNGRANAYHAAANASNTPWFFTVFAKLEMNKQFDFNWQPDRLQARKHYIFTATNPVNDLEYGHQALIVYNKNLTLNNPGIGLDFTLDDLHEVVDINSGIARYNTDPYSTWRTAFREVIKLCCNTDQVSIDRKSSWLTIGNSEYGEYSTLGAKDAVDYYELVEGDIEKLKLSYEWNWLNKYYASKHK